MPGSQGAPPRVVPPEPAFQTHVSCTASQPPQSECKPDLAEAGSPKPEAGWNPVMLIVPFMTSSVGFGEYRFDPDTGQLWFRGEEVRLTPKAAEVLKLLVSHAGAPV